MSRAPKSKLFAALAFAWELGFLIVLPLGGLLVLGIWLDGKFQSSPLFLLLGVIAGTAITSLLVYRRLGKVLED